MTTPLEFNALAPGVRVIGLSQEGACKIVNAEFFGSEAAKLVYEDPSKSICERLIY